MDLVSSCKEKVASFRIKELKDVLTQLGLAKQGKKQELVDRILGLLSDEPASKSHVWPRKNNIGKESVAKTIDDTYRKMQGSGATDLASKSLSGSEINHVKPKEEAADSIQMEMKVRCPCGNSLLSESMVKCEDPRCQVWQHISCVIIPEKPTEGFLPEVPSCFYCEICRINRADPFWVTVEHPLLPVKIQNSGMTGPDGTSTVQSVERTFQLSKSNRELLQRTDHDLQVWCVLLNDKVPFRMQWPQFADLQVNGIQVRVINRPGTQMLGINGRDDGPVITTCSREGINKICLSRCDSRVFCVGIRIGRRRTLQQVLNLVPKEEDGEPFEQALTRVHRCVGGGNTTDNADNDSDIEVVADSITVNLRCPNSGSRIKIAGRFKPCVHMGCFDLETFVELNQRSRKWQCPICLKNYTLENIIVDPYFNRITSLMRNCGEDVNEIDVKPDGSWRVKNESGDLAQWHLPDGSLARMDADVKPNLAAFKQVKQETASEGHTGLRLGIKRRNGVWEVSKPEDHKLSSSGNRGLENLDNHRQNIVRMSSSATGSYRDGDDSSVNQDGGGNFDFSLNNGHEFDSMSFGFDQLTNAEDGNATVQFQETDVIVLSDSEDDNITIYGPHQSNGTVNSNFVHPGVSATYSENPGLLNNGTSSLGLFKNDNDDFGLWPLQTGTQLQLFATDSEVPGALVDVQQNSLPPIASYCLVSEDALAEPSQAHDIPASYPNTEMNGRLVDDPLAFAGDDPSLQIFLPSRTAESPLQTVAGNHDEMPNGARPDDWISLSLGGTGARHGESGTASGLNPLRQVNTKDSRMDALANTASLLLSRSEGREKGASTDGQRSESPFTHPRQPRSVRPRLYLSIDTDSE